MIWQTSRFSIDLSQPRVMGIVNVTPDSFSDGGSHHTTALALRHCEQLIKDGAHILDIGGESTRPGSPAVPLAEELARVVPLVRDAVSLGVPLSIDTYKPEVMQAVLGLGADIVNDIWALRQPGAVDVVAAHPQCGVCLMHMHRDPQTMQVAPMDGDVVEQVLMFLERSAKALQGHGVEKTRIVLDPGIGFGKTVAQNFALLARQRSLLAAGYPLLAGWSRKSSLGSVTGLVQASGRMVPSVAAAVLAVEQGATVVRVHDVKDTVDGLAVLAAMQEQQ
jgi:dihydropteroate synthase